MKHIALFAALLALPLTLFAEPVKVGGSQVTFEAPEGFKPVSKEMIAT